mmetsp:Transcript_31977/g.59517  ORF Transcript_31977/g.59517 Transcript_31977/m.59517 type:complete len:131 (+) Transcript_31977:456-848(+)
MFRRKARCSVVRSQSYGSICQNQMRATRTTNGRIDALVACMHRPGRVLSVAARWRGAAAYLPCVNSRYTRRLLPAPAQKKQKKIWSTQLMSGYAAMRVREDLKQSVLDASHMANQSQSCAVRHPCAAPSG